MPCPICSNDFNIPTNGFAGLPLNVFLARLIERKNTLSCSVRSFCDLCPSDNQQDSPAVVVKHCNECQLNLCHRCCLHHDKNKLTKQHTLAKGAKESFETHEPELCGKHIDEKLKIYCHSCVEVCCSMCFIENHSGHEWALIEVVASDFKNQIHSNVDELSTCIRETKSKKETLRLKESEIRKSAIEIEKAVNVQRNHLKTIIDKHAESVICELKRREHDNLKEIEIASNDLDRHLVNLKSFGGYCSSILETGTDFEICRVENDLTLRVKQLREDKTKVLQHQVNPVFPLFTPSNMEGLSFVINELFGRLEEGTSEHKVQESEKANMKNSTACEFEREVVLLDTIITRAADEGNLALWGVAHLNNEIFILTSRCSTIEVYNAESFMFRRQWSLEGIRNPQDIAACDTKQCLYVIDWFSKNIFITDPDGFVIKKWSVGKCVGRLSMTRESNILLAAYDEAKLLEYDSNGILLCTINVLSIARLDHAIKLGIDRYLVCDKGDDQWCKMCIVDNNGKAVNTFEQANVPNRNRINRPIYLAAAGNGCILVADWFKKNVVLLNQDLSYRKQIVFIDDGRPYRLCLDESNRRLYVVDNVNGSDGGQVSIYAL